MYTIKVRYGAISDFLGALQTGSSMTEIMTSAMLEPELLAPSPEFTSALAKKGQSLDDIRLAGKHIRKGDQRTVKALAPFKTAMAHAGIFPPGHIMETPVDQVLELVVDAEAVRALVSVASATAGTLRLLAAGPPKELVGKQEAIFPLDILFKGPSELLEKTAPEVFKALLDAGAPLI